MKKSSKKYVIRCLRTNSSYFAFDSPKEVAKFLWGRIMSDWDVYSLVDLKSRECLNIEKELLDRSSEKE